MKVIIRGKPPGEIPWRGVCHKCHSELEAGKDELSHNYCPREHTNYAHGTCPVCNNAHVTFTQVTCGHY